MTTVEENKHFLFALDNGGEDNKENGGTMDRYTIQLLDEDGNSISISSNGVCSVWGWDNGYLSLEDIINNEEDNKHLGHEIQWHDLPSTLANTINDYFNTESLEI